MVQIQGYLNSVVRVFGYLKKHWKARIMIDPNYPKHLDYPNPEHDNWKEFYPNVDEHIPNKAEIPDQKGSVVFSYALRMLIIHMIFLQDGQ